MGTHVNRVPIHTPTTTNITYDDAEILNLFESIHSYRFDATTYARGSSSSSSSLASTTCTQTFSRSPNPNALPYELIDYFCHTLHSNKELRKVQKRPIVSTMAKDLLTSHVSTITSESAFSVGKRVVSEVRVD